MSRTTEALDWDDLKVFIQVARARSLGGAARKLGVDHSTVSRRVAQLEASLGYAVFDRLPTGLRLSDVGERLLERAERVESAVLALEEVAEGASGASGRVRVATMEGIASLYLASRFSEFRTRHPALTVELVTSPQTVYVNRREADLFLSFFPQPGRGLASERVGRFRLKLYASRAYLAERGTPAGAAELGRHRFVSYVPDLIRVDSVRWLDDVVSQPSVAFQSNSMIAQMHAAAGGMGLVLLPEFAVAHEPRLVPVLAEEVGTTREVWLALHGDVQFLPRVKAVVSFLKSTLRGDPGMQVEPAADDGGRPTGPDAAPAADGGRP